MKLNKKIITIIVLAMLILTIVLIVDIDRVCSVKSNTNTFSDNQVIVNYRSLFEMNALQHKLPTARTYLSMINMPELPQQEDIIVEEVPTPEVEATVKEEPVTETPVYIQEIDDGTYIVATYVWNYLKEAGFNDYVCAGIMGNLMAETGGQTLNLNWEAWSEGSYYGIAQWSKKFYPNVIGKNLTEQCDFLLDTIKYEFDTFGYAYSKGFNYDKFLELDNEKEAALAFAKCYERCNSAYYSVRESNATKAYEYFGR